MGGRSEALDQRDGEGHGLVGLEARLLDEKSGQDPVADLQDRREQLRMGREQRGSSWIISIPKASASCRRCRS